MHWTLCLAALAVSGVLVASRPADEAPGQVDLSSVWNRTMCPVEVDYDVDEERVPKRIKVLKCGRDPQEHCRSQNVPAYECCQSSRADVRMECVEVQDLVQVYYPQQPEAARAQPLRVSVGCVCAVDAVPRAHPSEPS